MKKIICFIIIAFSFLMSFAQVPSTDIFIVDVTVEKGKYVFGNPFNITHRDGYDNQPSFSYDGSVLLYSSMRDTLQTDIFYYRFIDSTTSRVTESKESEYSPVMLADGKHISVISVDSSKAQHFCTINALDQKVSPLITGEDSAAYYVWLSPSVFAMCVLNRIMNLNIYKLIEGSFAQVTSNVGRCLVKYPNTEDVCFVQIVSDSDKTIMRYSHKSGPVYAVGKVLQGSEDFTVMPDGNFMMGKDGKLFVLNVFEKKWKEIADFSKTVGNFYRLVASPDGKRIALVSYAGKKP